LDSFLNRKGAIMRRWLVMLSLVAVAAVGFAVAQDDDKPKAKAQPKAKKGDDGLELEADPNALGKKPANKKELLDKISYALGRNIGKAKQNGFDIDPKRVIKGMEDALQGKDSEFSDEEIERAFEAYRPIARLAMAKVGEDFLAANKDKEGVKTLASGVQYKGRLIDGKFFDGSYTGDAPTKRDKPAEFPLNGVIKGFKESLTHMKVGDRWTVYIPSDLAYGERGSPPSIGPNAVLIFDLELVEIIE
jgi:FKBP-type peptidyl-prolyl cis-trans isomerase